MMSHFKTYRSPEKKNTVMGSDGTRNQELLTAKLLLAFARTVIIGFTI
jgi:hypothetical protein